MKKLFIAALLCTGLAFTANAQQGTSTQQPTKAGQENTKGHQHHAKKDGKHAMKKQPADKAATTPAKTEPKKK